MSESVSDRPSAPITGKSTAAPPAAVGPSRRGAGAGPALARPPLLPMVAVRRVALFQREVRDRIAASAVDLLLDRAIVLSEGSVAGSAPGTSGRRYFGSTMLTMDLAAIADLAETHARGDNTGSGPEVASHKLASLAVGDARFLQRVRAIGEREAQERAGCRLDSPTAEVRVRAEGSRLFVDVDVEAAVVERLRLVTGGRGGT